jgi:hypothetical protein
MLKNAWRITGQLYRLNLRVQLELNNTITSLQSSVGVPLRSNCVLRYALAWSPQLSFRQQVCN